jgi:NTE family protein
VADEGQHGALGLALSGGGHRAAFFHIGVLARLAELGRLRGIEVISTVSGGSMVGAAYYLYVKKLLETTPNAQITDQHYVEVVKQLEAHYRQAMAKNLRGLALANYFKNYWLVMPNYSRTNRIAEVLEKEFYRPIIGGSGPIDLDELRIEPLDDNGNKLENFDPRTDRRKLDTAPAPILLMNATTLNTGHSFRFEATWIGEPELTSVENADVDKNSRFVRWRRNYLPEDQRKTLGIAVASSGCFPGGLAPVAIKGMYGKLADQPDKKWRFVLKLVDGGVRDNQGIDALLENPCDRLIISDGSLQLNEVLDAGTRLPALLPRVASIEGKESREQRILRAYKSCGEDHVAFMHLLSGVKPVLIEPLDGTGPGPPPPPQPAPVGIWPFTEVLIAQMRTDLDAFSDLEASAVMQTGYRVACAELRGPQAPSEVLQGATPVGEHSWRFGVVDGALTAPLSTGLERHLRVSHMIFLKPLAYIALHLPQWFRRLVLAGLALGVLVVLGVVGYHLTGKTVPADLLYASGVGFVIVLGLYLGSQVPVLRLFTRALFDVLVPLLGALLPFFLFAWAQLVSGRLHRALGPDGAP